MKYFFADMGDTNFSFSPAGYNFEMTGTLLGLGLRKRKFINGHKVQPPEKTSFLPVHTYKIATND